MKIKNISERISYLPASENPLSSDVGIIRGDKYVWIFDVGASDESAKAIQALEKEKNLVLSHFHEDHIKNVERVSYRNIYCGNYTYFKLQKGTVVQNSLAFFDGVKLTIFPIPTVHAKGALGLEVNEEYAFLGDAVYCARKKGKAVYNVNLLKETITTLKLLKADRFLISHSPEFVHEKESVISELTEIYENRTSGETFIFLEE